MQNFNDQSPYDFYIDPTFEEMNELEQNVSFVLGDLEASIIHGKKTNQG